MHTDQHGLPSKEETGKIIGCAMEVLNELGHGFIERPYENALVVEFGFQDVPYRQQERYSVTYKGVQVGEYVPDLIVYDKVVVDAKVIEQIGDHEIGQMINYLKIAGLRVGLILNFKQAKLRWKRLIL